MEANRNITLQPNSEINFLFIASINGKKKSSQLTYFCVYLKRFKYFNNVWTRTAFNRLKSFSFCTRTKHETIIDNLKERPEKPHICTHVLKPKSNQPKFNTM